MANASQRVATLHDLGSVVPGLPAALREAPQALRVHAACKYRLLRCMKPYAFNPYH